MQHLKLNLIHYYVIEIIFSTLCIPECRENSNSIIIINTLVSFYNFESFEKFNDKKEIKYKYIYKLYAPSRN